MTSPFAFFFRLQLDMKPFLALLFLSCVRSEVLDELVHTITESMNSNCILVLIQNGSDYNLNLKNTTSVIISNPESIHQILKYSFDFNCQGYVVQMQNPWDFLHIWDMRRNEDLRRHSPKMLFLPWNESFYADRLFASDVAQFLSDLIAVQASDKNFDILSNNFPKNDKSWTKIATWPTDRMEWFPDKILDLQGKTLKYATIQYPPYSQLTPVFDGMEIKLSQTFCEFYNCVLKPVTDDDLWGEIWTNKSGNGVLGNVYTGKADVGAGAVYLWYNEYKYLEYSYPYHESRVTVLVPKPTQLPEWSIPIIAFSPTLWIAFSISIATVAIILYLVNKTAGKISHVYNGGEFSSFFGILLRVFGMSLLQPPPSRFITGSILQRFFTIFEVLFLLFATIYSGALSSVLTVPGYNPPIDSPMDLYKSGITWMADHEAWIYSLQQANEKHLQGLVKKFEAHETKDLIGYAKEGGYGFSIEIMAAGHVTHTAHLSSEMITGLHVMKKELYDALSATVFQKGSPYVEKFNWLIHRCLDAGLFLAWETQSSLKYLSSRLQTALIISESNSQKLNNPVKLRLNHVQGAFIFLSLGSAVAFIVFIIEILFTKRDSHMK